jgi:membrane-associated phospholipid phosphatase
MVGGLGGGWQGGGWQGGGWQGGGWQGGGWQGGGWAGGGGSEGLYAMRADRPLVQEDVAQPPPPDGNPNPSFPLKAWDSDLFALTFLADFFTATVGGKTWAGLAGWETDIINAIGPVPAVVMPGGAGAGDRIDDLRILAVTERPEAMGEILNQHQNQQLCFMQLLTMTATSHPKTFFVMKLAARVGEVVMMRLKRHFNRPRPTQYYPTLFPPVPVPGHSAYPAGHALIAQLTAKVLIEVTTVTAIGRSPYKNSLSKLAEQIGRNRVIAGFHFRSDITAGVTAADMTYQFLSGMPAGAVAPPNFDYRSAVTAANAEEWN